MSSYPHPIIAREGWPFLGISFLVSVLAAWLVGWWSIPFWLATVFILQFFRDRHATFPRTRPSSRRRPTGG